MALLDVFELIRRITGRTLRLNTIEPQSSDLCDPYAETTGARTDLAFTAAVMLGTAVAVRVSTDDRGRPLLAND